MGTAEFEARLIDANAKLDEAEATCRLFLAWKLKLANIESQSRVKEQLVEYLSGDPVNSDERELVGEVLSVLFGVMRAREEIEHAMSITDIEISNFESLYEYFRTLSYPILSAIREFTAPLQELQATRFDKGLREHNENKRMKSKDDKALVLKRFAALEETGIKRHKLVSTYISQFGNGIAERTLRKYLQEFI